MPRAKRAKVISLTKTEKKTKEDKSNLMDRVRDAAQEFPYAWLIAVGNMRNNYLKEVRDKWKGSKIFFGKLKVIAKALGTTEEEEIRTGISGISTRLTGNVGILFTDSPPAEVIDWFQDYTRVDFARAGFKATETVELPEGKLPFPFPFYMRLTCLLSVLGPVMARTTPPEALPHPIEPQLRKLGMPTELKRGVPTLLRDYTVCKKGETLSADQAQILKHLLIQMSHFKLVPLAYWSEADQESGKGVRGVTSLEVSPEDQKLIGSEAGQENNKKDGTARSARTKTSDEDDEEMDDEDDDEDDDEEFEDGDKVDASMMLPAGMA